MGIDTNLNFKIEATTISIKLISFRLTILKRTSLENKALCITVGWSLNLVQPAHKKFNLNAAIQDLYLILELINMLILFG